MSAIKIFNPQGYGVKITDPVAGYFVKVVTGSGTGTGGSDGREVQLRNNGTHIQWKYENEVAWTDLITLSSLTGEDGLSTEIQNNGTHIQWRREGEVSWTNLVALADLQGANGKQVEFQKSATHIQWRYVGDPTWINIVALDDITGPTGASPTWIDISASATFTGWASFTRKTVLYSIAGGLIFFAVDVEGESSGGSATISFPEGTGHSLIPEQWDEFRARTATGWTTGEAKITASGSVITFHPTAAAGNWPSSGIKVCIGALQYAIN